MKPLQRSALGLLALFSLTGFGGPPPIDTSCSVSISFRSYCCGIDYSALKAMAPYILRDAPITEIRKERWGGEGEFDLCFVIESKVAAQEVFSRIKSFIPEYSRKSTTKVIGPDGETFSTKWPKENQ